MSKVIVYENGSGISILHPALQDPSIQGIEWVARKDVPQGVPFWIIDASSIPEDRTFREAWELDHESLGKPDGKGDPEGVAAEWQAAADARAKEEAEALAAREQELKKAKEEGEAFDAAQQQPQVDEEGEK